METVALLPAELNLQELCADHLKEFVILKKFAMVLLDLVLLTTVLLRQLFVEEFKGPAILPKIAILLPQIGGTVQLIFMKLMQ